jgi:RHS repeat-associated protein
LFTVTDPLAGVSWSFRPLPGVRPDGVSGRMVVPLEALADRNGNRMEIVYDDAGVPLEIAHSGGYRLEVETDPEIGRVVGLRLAGTDEPLVRYGYSEAGDLTSVVNSSGEPLVFTYDDDHRVTSWTDRNGTWYRYAYDTAGRCVHGYGSDRALDTTFVYDDVQRISQVTDSLGNVRTYEYNELMQVEREIDPLGQVTVKEWDRYNRLLSTTDPLGRTTSYAYDALGNLLGAVRPNGLVSVADYDETLCRLTAVTGLDGTRYRYQWDGNGNLLAQTDPAGAETAYAYDDRGFLSTVTDALGGVVRVECDAAGLPVAVTDPLGAVTRMERDAFGRVVAVTDPLGHVTRSGWTPEGKPAWREQPDGAREEWVWDGEGNLVGHRDALGQVTTYAATHFDLPSAQTGPDGVRYEFAYDTELRLTAVTNPQGLTWSYAYDPAGRLVGETDFNGRSLAYRHDAAGQLVSKTNGAGEVVDYTRDVSGRIVEQVHAATGRTTTFRHDAAGRLVRAVNPDVDLSFERDAIGRITAEISNGQALSSAYDVLGRRVERRTPAGSVSTWAWDAAGRPTRLSVDGNDMSFAYDRAGREISRRISPTVELTQAWDPAGRLATQALLVGEQVSKFTAAMEPDRAPRETIRRDYSYRADGYVTAIDDAVAGLKTYDLDATGRVTAVHARGWSERYAYDSLGNITHGQWPTADGDSEGVQGRRSFSGTLIRTSGRTRYDHDDQGRVVRHTRKLLSGGTKEWLFHWDADDRMIGAVVPGAAVWRYVYDPLGRRIAKQRLTAHGTVCDEVRFVWDGTRLTEQANFEGATVTWNYAPGSHRPLTQVDSANSMQQAEIDVRFHAIVTDLVGTPIEMVTPDAEVTWHRPTTLWNASSKDDIARRPLLRFPGQYHDAETGLDYNLYRYYAPNTGTYQSPDPLGLAPAPNPHGYVRDPLVWSDPLGLAPHCGEDPDGSDPDAPVVPSPVYENPGHHDPTGGPNPYVPKKAVLPDDAGQQFANSVLVDGTRWTKIGTGKNAEYYRYFDDGNGNWHWSGSTSGVTKSGTSVPIPMSRVPVEIRRS